MNEINNIGKLSPITQVGKVRGVDNALTNSYRGNMYSRRVKPTQAELEGAIEHVNESLNILDISLKIELEKETDRKVAQFVHTISGDVVKQFPAKEFVEWEREYVRLLGILFDQKA